MRFLRKLRKVMKKISQNSPTSPVIADQWRNIRNVAIGENWKGKKKRKWKGRNKNRLFFFKMEGK